MLNINDAINNILHYKNRISENGLIFLINY